jgi:molybdate/tungstate transport system substrate-binding protein
MLKTTINMKQFIFLIVFCVSVLVIGCRSGNDQQTIRIIHAGSLSLVVKQVAEAYKVEHPDAIILTEAWGSKDGARQITELNKPCDIYISADERIIRDFLVPEHASWWIPFAGNEMVLAFRNESRFAGHINKNNWFSILSREDVKTARSSPDADPCGVRAVLLMKLSDIHYYNPNISVSLLQKDLNFIRPKEADLIALLEKQSVDYLYIYKSIAVQHHFRYLELPDEINLSNPAMDALYRNASLQTVGKTPASQHLEVGAPIVYGVTIPDRAQNPRAAEQFLEFFLDPEKGASILIKNGQNFLPASRVGCYKAIPERLKPFVLPDE